MQQQNLSPEARRRALLSPELRARILREKNLPAGQFERFVTESFGKMYRMDAGFDYEPAASSSLLAEAQRRGCDPQTLAYEWLSEDAGNGMIYFPLFNYAEGNLDCLQALHSHPLTRMGLSDAGAHCGAICDGGMPTFMLSHWTRVSNDSA